MRTLLYRFDRRVIIAIQNWPTWVRPFMILATTAAHPLVVVALAVGLILFGLETAPMIELCGWTIIGALFLGSILKLVLRRRRPITYVVKRWFTTFSFPSGHAIGATVTYGAFIYLAWVFVAVPIASIITLLGVGLIVAVGVSRVYLGAHYPSDVVAGWFIGALAVIFIRLVGMMV